MGPRVINVFIYDSIAVGEDGPTHEPVEQLTGLRKAGNAGSVTTVPVLA